MRIQDAVLDALEKNRGEYLSGEQLASSLGVSRNAVWKAIQKLEEAGHKIRAVPKRGYTLAPESDVLTVQSVSRFLDTDMPVYLQVQTEVTSTNTLLKAQAEQGAPEGTVLIAESQTAGKGRLGRHFTSPPGTGIYFSLLLRPHCTAEKSLFITTTAAVAVCEAIEQVTGLNPQIKWVNDVYLNEKKVCGILTGASVDFENGGSQLGRARHRHQHRCAGRGLPGGDSLHRRCYFRRPVPRGDAQPHFGRRHQPAFSRCIEPRLERVHRIVPQPFVSHRPRHHVLARGGDVPRCRHRHQRRSAPARPSR